jgi:hypothetical protein
MAGGILLEPRISQADQQKGSLCKRVLALSTENITRGPLISPHDDTGLTHPSSSHDGQKCDIIVTGLPGDPTMPLTMTPRRFLEIKAEMERRRLAEKAATIDAETDWNARPAFTSVDEFLAFLDKKATDDRPARSSRKRR